METLKKKKKKEQLDCNVQCELCQVLKGQNDRCQVIDMPDSDSWWSKSAIS